MFDFIMENLATILVGVVVFAIVAASAATMIRDRKNKGASCLGGCPGCAAAGKCGRSR